MDFDLELNIDISSLEVAFAHYQRNFWAECGAALREEAEVEMTEAKKRTPVATGALRSSGIVTGPFFTGDIVAEVKLGFGGSAVPYAFFVHEDTEAFHHVGQARYLASTLEESAPYMADRVAARLAKRVMR